MRKFPSHVNSCAGYGIKLCMNRSAFCRYALLVGFCLWHSAQGDTVPITVRLIVQKAQVGWPVNPESMEFGSVVVVTTSLGSYAAYVPHDPKDILVLAHGYPWPDDSRSMSQLIDHITAYARRWEDFAEERGLILIIPAFGSGPFNG
jgi:hypothetical protein